jgi:hypothetical protein
LFAVERALFAFVLADAAVLAALFATAKVDAISSCFVVFFDTPACTTYRTSASLLVVAAVSCVTF